MRKPERPENLELEIHLAAMNIGAGDNLTTEFKYYSVSKDRIASQGRQF